MAVVAREAWTDERLDDLKDEVKKIDLRMEAGFGGMRTEFKSVRSEMREEFKAIRDEMHGEFQGIRREMEGIRTEIGAFNRTVIQFAWAVVGTMFLSSMGTIAALITIV
jgi:predicted  nucleic acid-binding Zn-ribbon protein